MPPKWFIRTLPATMALLMLVLSSGCSDPAADDAEKARQAVEFLRETGLSEEALAVHDFANALDGKGSEATRRAIEEEIAALRRRRVPHIDTDLVMRVERPSLPTTPDSARDLLDDLRHLHIASPLTTIVHPGRGVARHRLELRALFDTPQGYRIPVPDPGTEFTVSIGFTVVSCAFDASININLAPAAAVPDQWDIRRSPGLCLHFGLGGGGNQETGVGAFQHTVQISWGPRWVVQSSLHDASWIPGLPLDMTFTYRADAATAIVTDRFTGETILSGQLENPGPLPKGPWVLAWTPNKHSNTIVAIIDRVTVDAMARHDSFVHAAPPASFIQHEKGDAIVPDPKDPFPGLAARAMVHLKPDADADTIEKGMEALEAAIVQLSDDVPDDPQQVAPDFRDRLLRRTIAIVTDLHGAAMRSAGLADDLRELSSASYKRCLTRLQKFGASTELTNRIIELGRLAARVPEWNPRW